MMEHCRELISWRPQRFFTVRTPASAPLASDRYLSSSHSIREICIVLNGESRYYFNGSVYPALPGDVFLIDRWMPHGLNYTEADHDLVHLWLAFTRKNFTGVIIKIQEHGQFMRLNTCHILPPEYDKIMTARWDQWNQQPVAPVEDFLTVPLQSVVDEIRFQQSCEEDPKTAETPVRKVIEAIKHHIASSNARNCSIRQLEQLSGYSGSYLSHKFRELEKCTLGDWIDQVRIDYTVSAQKRGLKQKEIAFELGFSTPANFWLWLRKHQNTIRQKLNASFNKENAR